jgi:hypothetical protein
MFGLFGAKSIDNNLAFQIPNLDGIVRSGTQPVTVGRKDQSIDNFTSIQRVQTLALVQVPQHGSVVLTTGSSKGAIRRDTDSVQVSSVSDQVVAKLAVGQVPDLDKLVPSSGDNQRNRLRRRETDARDPLGVSLGFSTDLVLAFSQSVPQTNSGITRT